MKIDLRVLTIASCFMLIAASAVVIVRYAEKGDSLPFVENIPSRGVATSERVPAGLQLHVGLNGLSLVLPTCDTNEYREKFFLHVYTEAGIDKMPAKFVNMDFDLAQERGKETVSNGVKKCIFQKNFGDLAVKEVAIGQFTTPDGRCCDITWSRHFHFDVKLR